MKQILSAALLGAMVTVAAVHAQEAGALIDAAARAMGTAGVQSIQYSGAGSVFMMGQNVRPDAPWPRFRVVTYDAGVRYDVPAFREELVTSTMSVPPAAAAPGGSIRRPARAACGPFSASRRRSGRPLRAPRSASSRSG